MSVSVSVCVCVCVNVCEMYIVSKHTIQYGNWDISRIPRYVNKLAEVNITGKLQSTLHHSLNIATLSTKDSTMPPLVLDNSTSMGNLVTHYIIE